MQFRTEIAIPQAPFSISHKDEVVMIGSCFSDNIGMRLQRYRFPVQINSHGIVFNPESVAVSLEDILHHKNYTSSDLIPFNGAFLSLNHHGQFNNREETKVLQQINDNIASFHQKLKTAKVLFVTFGSAWAYRYKATNRIVANCHKIPQAQFDKVLISYQETEIRWKALIEKLHAFNPELNLVFTISPVRHWRDGAVQNQLSKSHLTVAVHNLVNTFPFAYYFPAYELVIDDLRDYRFFKEDMLHPNETAVEYVWQKFTAWCMGESTQKKIQQIEPLVRFTEHRPINISEEDFQKEKMEKEMKIEEIIR